MNVNLIQSIQKYTSFLYILIILSLFDIATTTYAISKYPELKEGNPIMALFVSSLFGFVIVKAFSVMVIAGIYHRIKAQHAIYAKIGQSIIIVMMLFVVGNNMIQIGSAISFGYPAPYELESPARINIDGSTDYAFMGHNNNNVTDYFGFNVSDASGLIYSASNRFYSTNMVRYAVVDWAHPQRLFLVFSNLDVAYTDSIGTNYGNGYYADNVWPISGCSNCNDLHKIGVLTTLNPTMAGYVDLNGDLIIAEGLNIIKFVRSSDYTKTTLFAVTGYTASQTSDVVSDIKIGVDGKYHILVSGTRTNCGNNAYLQQLTFSSTHAFLYKVILATSNCEADTSINYGKILLPLTPQNNTTDFVYGYKYLNIIYLKYHNATATTDICPTSCSVISDFDGLQIYGGYAYIASSSENKIYRFPTTIQVSNGAGYTPGAGPESTDVPDITYTEKSINSLYANYYNTSKFVVQAKINFASGNWPTSVNYGINDQAYRWQIKLIDPNGVTVNSWDTGECDASGLTHCELSILREYSPPSTGWQPGQWYVKLYEHKIDGTLFGAAPMGNLALLTASATWAVLNSSVNSTGTIGDPSESINSPGNQVTISLFDNYVGLLGFGIDGVSKFLFALLVIILLFVVGMYYGKSGMIGLALSSLPYTFFAYISYVPKWTFIIYIILLVVISKVFR